jgi:hypothetical protein
MENMNPNQKWKATNVPHIKAYQSTYYQRTKWKRMPAMNERAKENYYLQKELKRQRMCLLDEFVRS